MHALRWMILLIIFLLGLLGLGQQMTWAAESEIEYRFERMVPQLEQPWYFNYPSGIAVAQDGSVWVADTLNHRIQHLKADGGFITKFGSKGSDAGQFDTPEGIAIAADGSVWVADTRNHRIQHFNADGSFNSQFGNYGSNSSVADAGIGQFNRPSGIALAADGSVWVADTDNARIQHLKADGSFIAQFGIWGSGDGQFFSPSSIALAKDGGVWVTDIQNHRVQHFNADGGFITKFGSWGSGDGQFNSPQGITVAPDGSVWVADTRSHRIQHFNADGGFIAKFGSQSSGGGQFFPSDIALAVDGSMWMTSINDRIQHVKADGSVIAQFGSADSGDGQFNSAYAIAATADGSVWVADSNNHRIQHLKADGTFIAKFGSKGSGAGQFDTPAGIAIAADSSVWVADTYNHRIQHFNANGTFIAQFGGQGSGTGQFSYPEDIAATVDGSVWVVDAGNNRLQHLNANGSFIAQIGNNGSNTGWFSWPHSIALATDGSIWVADRNDYLQHFKADGSFIARFINLGSSAGQFYLIESIAVAQDGSVWVADAGNNRLQHLNANGSFIAQIGSQGSGTGQFNSPHSIALTVDGNMWVMDTGNHRIQKFVPRNKSSAAHPYKAIILAGGGEQYGGRVNDIWDGTWRITNKAYKAFNKQAFVVHDEIKFLTAGRREFDLDNNGKPDDLEAATKDSLRKAITEWASDAKDVVIFLANHGGPGTFRINSTDILSSEELNTWVTQLEQAIPGKVTVVIESCKSGSFFDQLSAPDRYVFASAKADQAAVISNDGLNSFSYFFWSEVATGAKLKVAFKDARKAMSATIVDTQARDAQADANGDRQSNAQDLEVLGDYYLGNGNALASDPPTIQALSPASKTLNGDSSYKFNFTLTHTEALNNAWALVQRPDDISIDPNQPLKFEKIPLDCSYGKGQSQCQGHYDRFDVAGEYHLAFYAMDRQEEVSSPETLVVTQTQGKSIAAVEYDDQQSTINLRDVLVGGQHYQAALQLDNGHFKLLAANPAAATFTSPATFDPASNVLDIPLVRAFGQNYQAKLKHIGNFAFELQGAAPK